jgi:hypothetical protein
MRAGLTVGFICAAAVAIVWIIGGVIIELNSGHHGDYVAGSANGAFQRGEPSVKATSSDLRH